jgi:hypothetical protein
MVAAPPPPHARDMTIITPLQTDLDDGGPTAAAFS